MTRHWKLFLYIVLLMSCFTAFSHGTQDLYPTFGHSLGFGTAQVSQLVIIGNVGAILGGIFFGAFSERVGRKRAIVIAALCSLPMIPLWAYAHSFVWLAVGAFAMQAMVQGAWGVVPVHLNELSPPEVRGTFPGLTYQLGNLVVSWGLPLQIGLAHLQGEDYRFALAIVAAVVAIAVALVVAIGRERKGVRFLAS